MRIATFNVQNMRLRDLPGRRALDGAADRDMNAVPDPALDRLDRRLTAEVLNVIQPDVAALQEVFDQATLDHFHDAYLLHTGSPPWPFRHCLPGNDGQGLNVALMSRIRPESVASHATETPAGLGLAGAPPDMADIPIFRRDCLEARLPGVTLFLCHFKAPYPDADRAREVRLLEAQAVRKLVERAFADPAAERWLILGDLNDPEPGAPSLAPLLGGFSVDLMDRLPPAETWSFREPDTGQTGRPDAMLVSPALAAAFPDTVPRVFRAGMDEAAARLSGRRFADVGRGRPHASDHAAVFADFDGL